VSERVPGPVTAVVLAAGASTRMGRPKALLPLDGVTFAERIAAIAIEGGAAEVLFVLGPPHGDAIREALPAGVAWTWNPAPERGMLSSAQAGVAALHHATAAALIWPVDVPLVAPETVRNLLAAEQHRIAVPQHAGRGGHPLRIPASLFRELLAIPVERSLRDLLADPARVLRVDVADPAILRDVDTPADYEALR
jgi:CTP:molybdopterin cytidylyltransferase MocA